MERLAETRANYVKSEAVRNQTSLASHQAEHCYLHRTKTSPAISAFSTCETTRTVQRKSISPRLSEGNVNKLELQLKQLIVGDDNGASDPFSNNKYDFFKSMPDLTNKDNLCKRDAFKSERRKENVDPSEVKTHSSPNEIQIKKVIGDNNLSNKLSSSFDDQHPKQYTAIKIISKSQKDTFYAKPVITRKLLFRKVFSAIDFKVF